MCIGLIHLYHKPLVGLDDEYEVRTGLMSHRPPKKDETTEKFQKVIHSSNL
jgi:hypothetical protein